MFQVLRVVLYVICLLKNFLLAVFFKFQIFIIHINFLHFKGWITVFPLREVFASHFLHLFQLILQKFLNFLCFPQIFSHFPIKYAFSFKLLLSLSEANPRFQYQIPLSIRFRVIYFALPGLHIFSSIKNSLLKSLFQHVQILLAFIELNITLNPAIQIVLKLFFLAPGAAKIIDFSLLAFAFIRTAISVIKKKKTIIITTATTIIIIIAVTTTVIDLQLLSFIKVQTLRIS